MKTSLSHHNNVIHITRTHLSDIRNIQPEERPGETCKIRCTFLASAKTLINIITNINFLKGQYGCLFPSESGNTNCPLNLFFPFVKTSPNSHCGLKPHYLPEFSYNWYLFLLSLQLSCLWFSGWFFFLFFCLQVKKSAQSKDPRGSSGVMTCLPKRN